MSKKKYLLTTVDNPFNPETQFDEWFAFDVSRGYNSLSLLARLTYISEEMSEADQEYIIEEAIQEIVKENVSGVHTLVEIE